MLGVLPAFREQGMRGEPGVELGDEARGRGHGRAPGVGPPGRDRGIAEVLVDVPDALARSDPGDAEQARPVPAQAHGGQPARRHEFVAHRLSRAQPLDDDGEDALGHREREPIDPGLEAFLLQQRRGRERPAERLIERLAQLGQAGLPGTRQGRWEALDHVSHSAASDPNPRETESAITRSEATGRLKYSGTPESKSRDSQSIPARLRKM